MSYTYYKIMCPMVKLVDTKDLKPLDVATLVYQTVSGSLKTLSILTFLFNPSINIRNQGKLICVDYYTER